MFGKRKQKNTRLESVVLITIPHDMWGNPRVREIEKAISDHIAKGYRLDKQYAEIAPKRTMLTFILNEQPPEAEAKGKKRR